LNFVQNTGLHYQQTTNSHHIEFREVFLEE
jgi:hypothetical protein